MQVLQRQDDLRGVEPGLLFGELASFRQKPEELATRAEVQYEEELFLGLEGIVHGYDEGMADFDEHVPLGFDMGLLFLFLDEVFFQDFHGVHLLVAFALHEDDFGVGALTDYGEH